VFGKNINSGKVIMEKQSLYILLVEDLEFAQKAVLNTLQKLNCKVDVVASGIVALELIIKNCYDLVFLDLELPDIDGIVVAETIRHVERKDRHIPIIALTAHCHENLEMKCKGVGFDDFLVKPLTLESARYILSKHLASFRE
jgi:CheY-like chemotaxis protein